MDGWIFYAWSKGWDCKRAEEAGGEGAKGREGEGGSNEPKHHHNYEARDTASKRWWEGNQDM
jgi:hypothetical protein